MPYELCTSLWRSVARAALGIALLGGCDGEDPTGMTGAGGGRPDGAMPPTDGATDDSSVDGAAGSRNDAGREASGDGASDDGALDPTDGARDPVDGARDDRASDAGTATDVDREDAPGSDDRDVDDDVGRGDGAPPDGDSDASVDGSDADGAPDAPPDVPRDLGPIVIGPPFRRSTTFAVIGDYGVANTDEARVANLVHSWDVDFVITTGDNDYTGHPDGIDGVIGRYYSDFIGNYWGAYGAGSQTTRFWPSPGNHDWDSAGLASYLNYFTLLGNERYYDVDLGLVHLFALDSDWREPDGTTADSVQGRWLEDRLARSTSCVNLVYFHHPAYSSGPHGSSVNMQWPFEAWGADAVFAGHDHVYERFEVGTIPYFTVGLGGAAPYTFVTSLPETRHQYNADFGALRVDVSRRGMLFEFFDANGMLVESFSTRKRCWQ
jgi:hypothetical protein